MKLELKHLAAYLPYKLKMITPDGERNLKGIDTVTPGNAIGLFYWVDTKREMSFHVDCKPLLRPLSNLTKEITHNGETFVPMLTLSKCFDMNIIEHCFIEQNFHPEYIKTFRYEVAQKLLEWHFDIYGLINAELAIDINTITKK